MSSFIAPVSKHTIKTIILAVILYGYETWSLMLKIEQKLQMFEKKRPRNYLDVRKSE